MTGTGSTWAARVYALPNSTFLVDTGAGLVLVNCPPETLKHLLALGYQPPTQVLLPPDIPPGQQLGSSGFVRRGINYASVEFILYYNFFVRRSRTSLITPTRGQAERLRRMLTETVEGPTDAASYAAYPWLPRECAAVAFYPPLNRPLQVSDLADIVSLEEGDGALAGNVRVRLEAEQYTFYRGREVVASVSPAIADTARPLTFAPARPLLRHELTLQFVGGSDGFDPAGITTCFLAYLGHEGATRATLFDAAAYLRIRLGHLGVAPNQIAEVVLSHVHEDHLAGLPELLLMGEHRVRLLTADIVYGSLLRLLSAMLALPEPDVAALFDFHPLNPGQPLELEGRRFEAIFAAHTVPTIAVRADALYYSGDMRYDERWFDEMVAQGVLSSERRAELLHFADGARVIVQDAGGGDIHTHITPEVLKALVAKSQRVILTHTPPHSLPSAEAPWAGQVEFASSGHVSAVGEQLAEQGDTARVETLSACPLFARLPLEERVALAAQTTLTRWRDGEAIVQRGEFVDGQTFVVHSGLVEIANQDKVLVVGRGSSLGERGLLLGGVRIGTLVARGPVELLMIQRHHFDRIAARLGLVEAISRADWLWGLPLFGSLPWATLLDVALDFEPRSLAAGETLFRLGEPGYECYLLVSGSVALTDEVRSLLIELTVPGEFFGGQAALYGTVHSASAHATQPSEVWALPATALQRLHMVYPNILLHLRTVSSAQAEHSDS